VLLFYLAFGLPAAEMSTICAIIIGVVGLLVLHRMCKPYNKIRTILMVSMAVLFVLMMVFFKDLFTMTALTFPSALVLVVFSLLAYPLMKTLSFGFDKLKEEYYAREKRKTAQVGRHVAVTKKK